MGNSLVGDLPGRMPLVPGAPAASSPQEVAACHAFTHST